MNFIYADIDKKHFIGYVKGICKTLTFMGYTCTNIEELNQPNDELITIKVTGVKPMLTVMMNSIKAGQVIVLSEETLKEYGFKDREMLNKFCQYHHFQWTENVNGVEIKNKVVPVN